MERSDVKKAKVIAVCGIMAALCVVIMLLGAVLGLGIYLAPMIAGVCLLLIRRAYGVKYHIIVWVAVSILSFILVPEMEENLMFLCLFGCYPIIYPYLQKLPKGLRIVVKLLYFNVVFIGVEALLMLVLVPEAIDTAFFVVLLLLANILFVCYDLVLPRAERLLDHYLGKLIRSK